MSNLTPLIACACWISLCGPVQADDLMPLEVGNKWIYVYEVFNGRHIGSYSIDTCAVEIGPEFIAVHNGQEYFAQGVGGQPCRPSSEAIYRGDNQGRLIRRIDGDVPVPDTSAFISDYPEFATIFRDQIESWSALEGEIVFVDTAFTASSHYPFTMAYLDWYGRYVDSILGYHAVRIGQEDSDDWPWPGEFPVPERLRRGSTRVAITYRSNLVAVEGGTVSLFEDGVGLVAEYGYSVLSPGRSLSTLVWASVGGVEYGDRPTAIESDSWAGAKGAARLGSRLP